MRTSALFGVENYRFFEIYGVSPWTKGEWGKGPVRKKGPVDKGPVRTFTDKERGKGQFYERTSFMDGP